MGVSPMDYVACAEQALRDHGLRITPQRRAILAFLQENQHHPSIEDIMDHLHKTMPSVSLSTVYQIMHTFADMGVVSRFETDGVMHFDPRVEPHAHLSCTSCGAIVDIPLVDAPEETLRRTVSDMGGRFDQYRVSIEGLCPSCASHIGISPV